MLSRGRHPEARAVPPDLHRSQGKEPLPSAQEFSLAPTPLSDQVPSEQRNQHIQQALGHAEGLASHSNDPEAAQQETRHRKRIAALQARRSRLEHQYQELRKAWWNPIKRRQANHTQEMLNLLDESLNLLLREVNFEQLHFRAFSDVLSSSVHQRANSLAETLPPSTLKDTIDTDAFEPLESFSPNDTIPVDPPQATL